MSDVLLMVASGSTTSRVYDYTRDNSPHQVQIQDVDNLIGMIKKSDNSMTDEDQVAALLVEFNMDAEGNVAGVKDDSRGQSAVVSINSQHMRIQRFPELLLVYYTHNPNSVTVQALNVYRKFVCGCSRFRTRQYRRDGCDTGTWKALEAKRSLPHPYHITSVHSPLQTTVQIGGANDGYNCGLFVCLFIWHCLAKEVGSDYTESGLMRRRWDILRMVLHATKPSATTD
ncbi:hypothetical protein PC114_g19388 [Phytophthora cactorum]|nr:hypothetical protein PC114_g19388 [Phytophthora cactorum]